MKRIHKHTLEICDIQTLSIHQDAIILHLDNQNENLCLWAMVDTTTPKVPRKIRVLGTGHTVPDKPLKFLGTVLIHPYVWHVFEDM